MVSSFYTSCFVCCVVQADDGVYITKNGKINFVDLAGSEMTKKTNSEGKTLEEANNINKSLMVLGKAKGWEGEGGTSINAKKKTVPTFTSNFLL